MRRSAERISVVISVVVVAAVLVLAGGPAAAIEGDVTFDGEAGTVSATQVVDATVSPAAARSGNGGLLIDATAERSFVRWSTTHVPQGHTHASVRLWVRVVSRAANESLDVVTVGNSLQTQNFDLFVNNLTGRFQWDLYRADWDQSDFVVQHGRWYLLEAQVEYAGDQHSATVRIDGVPQGTITSSGPATTVRQLTVGADIDKTHTQHYDDIALEVGDSARGWLADAPPLVAVPTPAPGAVYERGQVVTADYACAAPVLPLATCTGPVADGAPVDTSRLGPASFTVTGTDVAGNAASVTRTYTVVDGTEPTATVLRPDTGAVVARGGALTVDYACADEPGGSGLASCVGPVPAGSPLPTGKVGEHPLTVTATDRAGNTAWATSSYRVVPNRPDALIRAAGGRRTVGGDVYSRSGKGQVRQAKIRRGGFSLFVVRVQNDGAARDTFRIQGVPVDPRWKVVYRVGGRDVSAAVRAGRLRFADLDPGERRDLEVLVAATGRAHRGARKVVTVRATGYGARDAVRAVTRLA